MGEIAAASQEQAQGIEQVNTAVAEMDKVTQQNAANAEESACASEEMNAQAETMKGMVDELSERLSAAPAKAQRSGLPQRPVMRRKAPSRTRRFPPRSTSSRPRPAQPRNRPNRLPEAVIPLDDDQRFSDF